MLLAGRAPMEAKLKVVFAIGERGGKQHRTRIGVAWEADGRIGARLDALPVSGRIVIEDWEPATEVARAETRS